MTRLPEFRLEAYFARWEFTARYHLTASDAQTMTLTELLALAGDDDRRAWENLGLGYTPTAGDPALRRAIADTYTSLDAEDIVCFAGAEEGLYLAMQVLLGPDDHAVVITPNYQAAETVPMALCAVSAVALDPDRGWALDLQAVERALRPNTRVLSLCFPNNPTGKVIDAADFGRLVELCERRGIYVFSDEVHRGLERDPARTLPQAADLSERGLSLNVMSKALGLPGLRIGWIASRDRRLLACLERAKHYTTICNATPSEHLATIALKARDRILARNRRIVDTNLPRFDAFFAEFADLFEWSHPDGGCVAFPRYRGRDGAEAFCCALVEGAGVLLVPASIFSSALTATPQDRFRIGIGRRDAPEALETFAGWLRSR